MSEMLSLIICKASIAWYYIINNNDKLLQFWGEKMFRTIFGKQFTLYLSVLIISFFVLGAVLSQVIRQYLTEQRVEFLKDAGIKVSEELGMYYNYGMVDAQQLVNQYKNVQQYLSISEIVLNINMTVFVHSDDLALDKSIVFDQEELNPLRRGQSVVIKDGLPNMFSDQYIIVGYPVLNNGNLVAFALLISPVSDLDTTIWGMYKDIAICLLIAAAIGFILIYVLSRNMSKPLREMSDAARQISGGDFEKRVRVKGHDEVSQLADSLNNMAESLNQQERGRREFIANISHDLRSPLTSIRGFVQAIKDGAASPAKIDRYLDIVLDEAERLSKLANDMVDLSQAESRQLAIEKSVFDINRMIRDTAMLFETQIIQKKLNFGLSFADNQNMVIADREKIRRVIYNLLDNAIKFTPEAGTVVTETSLKDGRVWVTVRDNGVGISAEDQKFIFDRFYKADSSRGLDKRGNGLGLSIVREFTRVHGSVVTLVSSPGKGSAFTFALDAGSAD
jgi:signal transduction histidine kinase